MVGRVNKTDPSHVEHLETTALEELQLGFIEGPLCSGAEVTARLGREDWGVIRRLVQGAEMKFRPIDDCNEALLNQAYLVTSYLKLQDIGYIAGLAFCIAERFAAGDYGPARELWLGKCLDLGEAYKQMAVHSDHRHRAAIFFHDLARRPRYYVANSLRFGSCAAVYSCNRVSRNREFSLLDQTAKPRKLDCYFEKQPILIFTDGCWGKGFAGIGAVIVDTADGKKFVCMGVVPERLLDLWKRPWSQSSGARPCSGILFTRFLCSDVQLGCKGPSNSHISDGPSRLRCKETLGMLGMQTKHLLITQESC